jgi:hypothetical protein
MNAIVQTENEPRQLQRLAAQRYLYSTAKRLYGAQLILAGPIAVMWAGAVAISPNLKAAAGVWGVLISALDAIVLTPWQKRLRERAAKVQEMFDCDVLQLEWNHIKVGEKPDPELVKAAADKYAKIESRFPSLQDWYPQAVSEIPLDIARVICQRANCWWDAEQRRGYARLLLGCLVVVGLAILGLGLVRGLTLEKLILAVMLPLSPALLVAVRQFSEQSSAASRLDKLKGHAGQMWSDLCSEGDHADLNHKSRTLQDEIYDNRKCNSSVFDWMFQRVRSSYETRMNYTAQQLVDEAKERMRVS